LSADSLSEKSEPPNAPREIFSLGMAPILRRIVSATWDWIRRAKTVRISRRIRPDGQLQKFLL